MLIQLVTFTFAPQDAARAEAILRELREASRKEDGVIAFDVARSDEGLPEFVLWEHYEDKAAMAAHMASDHFKRLVIEGVRPLARQRVATMLVPI